MIYLRTTYKSISKHTKDLMKRDATKSKSHNWHINSDRIRKTQIKQIKLKGTYLLKIFQRDICEEHQPHSSVRLSKR